MLPKGVEEELSREATPEKVRSIANYYVPIYDLGEFDAQDKEYLVKIEQILLGTRNRLSPNEETDARNLVCAKKAPCTHFITFDKKHILNNRDVIRRALGLEVMKPSEFLHLLEQILQAD